jgi:hypothetical protein
MVLSSCDHATVRTLFCRAFGRLCVSVYTAYPRSCLSRNVLYVSRLVRTQLAIYNE